MGKGERTDHVAPGLAPGTLVGVCGDASAYLAYYDASGSVYVHLVEMPGSPMTNPIPWSTLTDRGSWVQDPSTWTND